MGIPGSSAKQMPQKELTAAELAAIRKLPGVSIGPPPDPARPKPRFIGIPSSKFNDVCAETIYRHQIISDNNTRVSVNAAARKLHEGGLTKKKGNQILYD